MPSIQPCFSLCRDASLTTQALPAKTAKTSDSAKPTTIVTTTKRTSTVTTTTAGSVAADGSGKNSEKKSTFLLVVIIGNQYARMSFPFSS